MGLTLQDLQDEVYENLGMDTDDIDPVKVRLYLNRAYWELYSKINFREVDSEVVLNMIVNQTHYRISDYVNDFDSIRHIVVKDYYGEQWNPVDQTDYDNLLNSEDDTVPSSDTQPTKYARFDNQIVFNYKPRNAYQLKIRYSKTLGDILTNGPTMPAAWHEVIIYGATARAWRAYGSAQKANDAAAEQFRLISTLIETETKEDRDYASSSMSIRKQRYP